MFPSELHMTTFVCKNFQKSPFPLGFAIKCSELKINTISKCQIKTIVDSPLHFDPNGVEKLHPSPVESQG